MSKNKIKGALYGFAVGDALGCTTEFMTESYVKQVYGTHRDIIGGGYLHWNKGDVTDDTDLMLCVGRAYMKGKEKFLDECVKEFSDWFRTNPRDVGNCCADVMQVCEGKEPLNWKEYSVYKQRMQQRDDLGNGSLMRALVPALYGDYDAAIDQGRLTHNNYVCTKEITLYATILYILAGDKSILPVAHGEEPDPTGHVSDTLNCALYALGKCNSFEDTLVHVVNRGGDADTIGAIAGSLAGVKYGYSAIPERWINALHKETKEELDELVRYIYTREEDD